MGTDEQRPPTDPRWRASPFNSSETFPVPGVSSAVPTRALALRPCYLQLRALLISSRAAEPGLTVARTQTPLVTRLSAEAPRVIIRWPHLFSKPHLESPSANCFNAPDNSDISVPPGNLSAR